MGKGSKRQDRHRKSYRVIFGMEGWNGLSLLSAFRKSNVLRKVVSQGDDEGVLAWRV